MTRAMRVSKTTKGQLLKGWPTDTTPCRLCGNPIQYFVYVEGHSGPKRPVPRYHRGHCKALGDLRRAEVRQQKYAAKQRQKRAAGVTV